MRITFRLEDSLWISKWQKVKDIPKAVIVGLHPLLSPTWLLALMAETYTRNSTTVAPPPPSFCPGSATDST
jgi:hypothetical protein